MRYFRAFLIGVLVLNVAFSAGRRGRNYRNSSKQTASPPKIPAAVFDPDVVNDPQLSVPIAPEDRGSAVLRAQILLDRANFSPGEIDGHYGRNLGKAIAAYQNARGLPQNS